MLVDIPLIQPNPYRDFNLYPFDEEQIESLILSYRDNGDFGVLPARRNGSPKTFQIACGHHRLEAMRRLGFNQADLKIGNYDDDQMIRIMVDENAKQMGQNSAAVLDSVCAAIRRIAYTTLSTDWNLAEEFFSQIYETKAGFGRARAALERGEGVGRDAVSRYLDRRLPDATIQSALTTIKASDLHLSIVNKVRERLEAERRESERKAEELRLEAERREQAARAEAERIAKERAAAEEKARREDEEWQRKRAQMAAERKAAEKQAKEAKEKRDREIAEQRKHELELRQKADEERRAAQIKIDEERRRAQDELRRKREIEAAKLAKEMEKKRATAEAERKRSQDSAKRATAAAQKVAENPPEHKFDARVANLFKNDYQLTLFRKAVTSGTLADVLPVEKQYDMAQACIDWHEKNHPRGRKGMTERSIIDWLNGELAKFLRFDRNISKAEERRALRESTIRRIDKGYDEILIGIGRIGTGFAILKEEYDKWPKDEEFPKKPLIQARLSDAINHLSRLSKILNH